MQCYTACLDRNDCDGSSQSRLDTTALFCSRNEAHQHARCTGVWRDDGCWFIAFQIQSYNVVSNPINYKHDANHFRKKRTVHPTVCDWFCCTTLLYFSTILLHPDSLRWFQWIVIRTYPLYPPMVSKPWLSTHVRYRNWPEDGWPTSLTVPRSMHAISCDGWPYLICQSDKPEMIHELITAQGSPNPSSGTPQENLATRSQIPTRILRICWVNMVYIPIKESWSPIHLYISICMRITQILNI